MNSSARNWCVPSYRTWTVRTTQKRSGAGPIRPTRPARAPCRWSAQPSGTFFYLIWFDLTLFFFSTAVLSFNSGWWLLSLPAGRDDVDDGVFTGFFFAGVRSYFEEGGGQDGEGRGQGKKNRGDDRLGRSVSFSESDNFGCVGRCTFPHPRPQKFDTRFSYIFFRFDFFFSISSCSLEAPFLFPSDVFTGTSMTPVRFFSVLIAPFFMTIKKGRLLSGTACGWHILTYCEFIWMNESLPTTNRWNKVRLPADWFSWMTLRWLSQGSLWKCPEFDLDSFKYPSLSRLICFFYSFEVSWKWKVELNLGVFVKKIRIHSKW